MYENYTCTNTGEKVGIGIYLSNHVEVAEIYCNK